MDAKSILILSIPWLIVVAVIYRVLFWPRKRLQLIYAEKFPDEWMLTLKHRLPFYDSLPEKLQQQLQNLIKVFIKDKLFIGCADQKIDDDIRVTIAAQACLLILNRKSNKYRKLQSILVYPSTFVTTREVRDELGLVSTSHSALLGESWEQGKIVLAWDSVEKGVMNLHDGHNVVLHEFAHQLDSESGTVNGAPVLLTRGAYKSWAQVFLKEYKHLQLRTAHHRKSLMDSYGATNPAEFFAVATETFFERPQEMAAHHQALYRELSAFYHLDPVTWLESAVKTTP